MPDWKKEVEAAIAPLNLSAAREAEVVEELSQHLNDRYEELLISGVGKEEAYRILKQNLIDGKLVAGLKATVRESPTPIPIGREKQERPLAGLWNHLHYGARLLIKSPGFAIVAILSLALGIGANTAIFQLIDAVRLRTLPVDKPQELAYIDFAKGSETSGQFTSRSAELTYAQWQEIHERPQAFSGTLAWSATQFNLAPGGEVRFTDGLFVSGDFFSVLGVSAVLGRTLTAQDD